MKTKNKIVVPCKEMIRKTKSSTVAVLHDDTIIVQATTGEKLSNKEGLLCDIKDSRISHLCIGKTGNLSLTVELSAKELLAFAKKAAKAEAYWQKWAKKRGDKTISYFKHFNPQLSFFFKGKVK